MKGEERLDSTTKRELTRALAKKGSQRETRLDVTTKQNGSRTKSAQETNTKRGEGDMQRPGMTCLVSQPLKGVRYQRRSRKRQYNHRA